MEAIDGRPPPLDQIFLVTTLIGFTNDILDRHIEIVGDVEKVSDLVEEYLLATFDREVLAKSNDSLRAAAFPGLVKKLGHVLAFEPIDFVRLVSNDLLLHVLGPLPWLRLNDPFSVTLQLLIEFARDLLSRFHHVFAGVVAENESHTRVRPPVEG